MYILTRLLETKFIPRYYIVSTHIISPSPKCILANCSL